MVDGTIGRNVNVFYWNLASHLIKPKMSRFLCFLYVTKLCSCINIYKADEISQVFFSKILAKKELILMIYKSEAQLGTLQINKMESFAKNFKQLEVVNSCYKALYLMCWRGSQLRLSNLRNWPENLETLVDVFEIRSFSGRFFSTFGLNTEIYPINLCI